MKGPNVGAEFEVRFSGGKMDGLILSYSDMRLPEIGEVGVYFVESLTKNQIHPLVGWSQGHFLEIIDSQGVARVHTAQKKPVISIKDDLKYTRQRQLVRGTDSALNVEVAPSSKPSTKQALNVLDFKKQINTSLLPGAD